MYIYVHVHNVCIQPVSYSISACVYKTMCSRNCDILFIILSLMSINLYMQLTIPWSSVLVCLFATSLAQVIDYYATSIASQHLDSHGVGRLSSIASFIFSLVLACLLWNYVPSSSDHEITAGVVIASILFILATPMLTRPQSRSSQSTLVGYSAAGLPLYQSQRGSSIVVDFLRPAFYKIMENSDSRRIFYFLLLNLVQLCLYCK